MWVFFIVWISLNTFLSSVSKILQSCFLLWTVQLQVNVMSLVLFIGKKIYIVLVYEGWILCTIIIYRIGNNQRGTFSGAWYTVAKTTSFNFRPEWCPRRPYLWTPVFASSNVQVSFPGCAWQKGPYQWSRSVLLLASEMFCLYFNLKCLNIGHKQKINFKIWRYCCSII